MNDKTKLLLALDPRAAELQEKLAKDKSSLDKNETGILGAILKSLQQQETEAVRMAFETNPNDKSGGFASLYRDKQYLTPDSVIKKIIGAAGDDLVCQILQARSNMISSFGRPRTSRFSVGFEFEEMNSHLIPENEAQYKQLQQEITKAKEVLWNCGFKGLKEDFHPNLSQFFKMIVRDGLAYGRFAVERIWVKDKEGRRKLHSFRAVDAGTIKRILPYREKDQSTRRKAISLLQQLKNEKFNPDQYKQDEYMWVQVVDGTPIQAFTEEELVVYNLYPVTNVEYNGYPLTPIDQTINAVTTHINITLHNKLYFQHGRAAKGFLVFTSDAVDEHLIQKVRLQFQQSINSVENSWRVPVFGVGQEEKIQWQPIEGQGRDAEFQYLMDSNSRVILSAFQMSPEELPGYAHLSRGTNTQALSEADNEWKLIAARDVGLRPLLYDIQDFINTHIFPLFFPELSKIYQFFLAGLDHDSPEKEATRIQQDMAIHMTYDDILDQVEKEKIGEELGGKFPLNAQFQQVVQSYLTFGEILENFFGRKGASADPRYDFYLNPLWMQFQQMQMQKAQIAMQNQMMQMQQAQQAMMPPSTEQPPQQPQPTGDENQDQQNIQKYEADFEKYISSNKEILNKAISDNHHSLSKQILARHKQLTEKKMKEWSKQAKTALSKIKSVVDEDEDK